MIEYAVLDDGVVVGYQYFAEPPVLKGKPYRMFLPVVVVDPEFDPALQKRSGPVVTIERERVTRAWTVIDKTAEEIAEEIDARREAAVAPVDNKEDALRAVVLMLLDELNLHSGRLAAVLSAAASATTLAQFKTSMAAIQPIPQRTAAQVRAAIRAKLGA